MNNCHIHISVCIHIHYIHKTYLVAGWVSTWFPDLWVRTLMIKKNEWESLRIPLPEEMMNPNQCHIPGGIVEISVTIRGLKEEGKVFPITSSAFSRRWINIIEWQLIILSLSSGNSHCSSWKQLWFACSCRLTHLLLPGVQTVKSFYLDPCP